MTEDLVTEGAMPEKRRFDMRGNKLLLMVMSWIALLLSAFYLLGSHGGFASANAHQLGSHGGFVSGSPHHEVLAWLGVVQFICYLGCRVVRFRAGSRESKQLQVEEN